MPIPETIAPDPAQQAVVAIQASISDAQRVVNQIRTGAQPRPPRPA
jgi:hypothetical protein